MYVYSVYVGMIIYHSDSDTVISLTHAVVCFHIKLIRTICRRYYCVMDDNAAARETIMKHGDSTVARHSASAAERGEEARVREEEEEEEVERWRG